MRRSFLRRSDLRRLQDIVTERQMQLAGRVLRQRDNRHPKTVIRWIPLNGKRKQGRPVKTGSKTLQEDLQNVNVKLDEAETAAADRRQCRTLIAECAQLHKRN
jgi:hypothetical protein